MNTRQAAHEKPIDRASLIRQTDNRDSAEMFKLLEAQIEALRTENAKLRERLAILGQPQ
jgi:uncharacterized protein YceH (UPF0502 family)